MQIPIEAPTLAGFVLAHAAWSISDVEPGELLVPFIIAESKEQRHVTRFEAESQETAIELGKEATTAATDTADAWAFAREGLMPHDGHKVDVLVVEFWARGMAQPALLLQRFLPVQQGQRFRLIDDPRVVVSGQILDLGDARPLLERYAAVLRAMPKLRRSGPTGTSVAPSRMMLSLTRACRT